MDLERLPSGKFVTNELVLKLAIIAYTILRMIGLDAIGGWGTETKQQDKAPPDAHSDREINHDGKSPAS